MDAQERARETARRLGWGDEFEKWEMDELVEQIHKAEQAARQEIQHKLDASLKRETLAIELALEAREKALEEAALKADQFADVDGAGRPLLWKPETISEAIRALAEEVT